MLKYRFFGFISFLLLMWACANQTTPSGGPKDTTPPKLLRSTPSQKQKNFHDKKIELVFDEAVNLNNPKDEILISPKIGKEVDFTVRKNAVSITPSKEWQENTTYSIFFRQGIRDITENNAPENLKLAFSTGPYIDSMALYGKVKLALTEKTIDKITVALYQSDTFNIFKHEPDYFTIANDKGIFSIENIKEGNYYIYAFEDKNKNLKVESNSEKFGFLKDETQLVGRIDSLTIPLVNLNTRELKLNSVRNNGLFTVLRFNKHITEYNLSNEKGISVVNSFGDSQTDIQFYNPKEIQDSLQFSIKATDSVDFKIDTTFYIKSMEPSFIPSDFTVKTEGPKYSISTSELTQNFQLSKPLAMLLYDSIFIETDSTHTITTNKADFSYDSIFKKIYFHKTIPQDSLFRNQKFLTQLIINPAAFISIENDSSKAQKHGITRLPEDKTGTLLIETKTEVPNYIIQVLNSGGEVVDMVKNSKKHTFKYLQPQNYKIRVIIDSNNNGRWDPGNIYKREEPEQVYFYQTPDKKYEFPIRANWELGPLMLIF